MEKAELLKKIKETVHGVEPGATVILYGSYARGEENMHLDIDLLILVDKDMSYADEKKIRYPLFDLWFDPGLVISPSVYSVKNWETKYYITPFKRMRRRRISLYDRS
ncbi:MAG TPA: nucleotidyltransferase domain-containing protein [Niabella sp.]|nr:nucleotidyltransferase domain-containing protein [Niabella sp.]